MEAGGIEPPSRDGSESASTCIVDIVFSRVAGGPSTGFPLPQPHGFSPAFGQAATAGQPAVVVAQASGRRLRDGLPSLRQPWHTCNRCQLLFLPGVLRGLPATSARHTFVFTPGRIQSPPNGSMPAISLGPWSNFMIAASAHFLHLIRERRSETEQIAHEGRSLVH